MKYKDSPDKLWSLNYSDHLDECQNGILPAGPIIYFPHWVLARGGA